MITFYPAPSGWRCPLGVRYILILTPWVMQFPNIYGNGDLSLKLRGWLLILLLLQEGDALWNRNIRMACISF